MACHSLNWRWCSAVWSHYFQEAAFKITPCTYICLQAAGWQVEPQQTLFSQWEAPTEARQEPWDRQDALVISATNTQHHNIWQGDAGSFNSAASCCGIASLPAFNGRRKLTWKHRSSGPFFQELVGCKPKVGRQVVSIGWWLCCFLYVYISSWGAELQPTWSRAWT